ncbi:hypothetical protein NIES21_50920 [Anabaenopsis circularis NIES-21]|uniref:Uncharacterized protein n=1 Tax=Anabaenopsis circularis NIES-21 TaxID=1085406 RepID=A0A1Z4GNY8_9CYAN|nr:hypothetical protein NIES21_50920 [Anabaenopsis circularis NIES-21]
MYRIICIGLMALPAYFYNAEPSLASDKHVSIIANNSTSHSINTQINLVPWRIFSREDQTGDCLRHGKCRD